MSNNRTPPLAWIFFFLMIAAFSSGSFNTVLALIAIGVILSALFSFGTFLMRSMFGESSVTLQDRRRAEQVPFAPPQLAAQDDDDDDLRPRVVPKQVAQRALQRAGNQPSDWLLSLEDIGLLAYHGDDTPDVVRLNPVAADTTHLRPFAVINIPYRQGRGTITFELFDELGTRRFIAREQYTLKQGANFVTPRTYLPLPAERTSGMWTLRLSIGDKRLAEHEFPVRTRVATPVRNLLAEDGEVDPWLARAIVEQGTQKSGLSLDELLASQSDDRESDSRLR
jgi:hypothetical protein